MDQNKLQMCFLSERDKAILSAMLWRAKTVCCRSKKEICKYMLILPLYFVIMLFARYSVQPKEYNVEAQQYISVTSSGNLTNAAGLNNFVDNNITTNFSLPNCTITGYDAQTIGYILPQSDFQSQEQSVIDAVLTTMVDAFNNNNLNATMKTKAFTSQNQLDEYVADVNYQDQQLCFAIGFNTFDLQNFNFDVSIQIPADWMPLNRLDQTRYQQAPYAVTKAGKGQLPHLLYQKYNYTGFQQLMTTTTSQVILSVLNFTNNLTFQPSFTVAYLPMNTGDFIVYPAQYIQTMIMGLLALGITFVQNSIIFKIVPEPHEAKLTKMLKQSGMSVQSEVIYRFSIYMIMAAILLPLITVFVKIVALPMVSFGVLLLFFIFYVLEQFALTIIVTYGFGKYSSVTTWFYIILTFLVTIYAAIDPNTTTNIVAITSILPNMQLLNLARLAFISQNSQLPTISISQLGIPIEGVRPGLILEVATFDLVVFCLFLLYLWPLTFNVDPDKKLRFYYPLTCTYWCQNHQQQNNNQNDIEQGINSSTLLLNQNDQKLLNQSKLQEDELEFVRSGEMENLRGNESEQTLVISKLVKQFGTKTAVNNLSLTLFKDQILVLLGHNGAGKTTTISMLTGEIKATSGTATSNGIDLLTDQSAIDLISFCPQTNVLIDKLTVQENLIFFCKFRGVDGAEAIIEQTLQDFNLSHKKHSLASTLSGGQKRKLQLMIALMGNQQIVLLDEPSSGMDPNSRRDTWNILKKLKKDRIIILTTHYMDEAEVLGDRIAILSHGQLQSCGSSLFLKNKYSNRFFIEVTQKDNSGVINLSKFERLLNSYLEKCDSQNLNKHVSETGKVVYTVPKDLGSQFQEIFSQIDNNLIDYNILEYTIRSASLEEVFIEIGEKEKLGKNSNEIVGQSGEVRTQLGEKSFSRTFKTFVYMNFQTSIPKIIFTTILTVLCIAISAGIALIGAKIPQPTIYLGQPQTYYGDTIITQVNQFTVDGSQDTQNFFLSQQSSLTYVQSNFNLQTNTPFDSLTSWAQNINPNNYGSVFAYSIPATPQSQNTMNLAVYGNLQSVVAQNVFGNQILQTIGQFYTGQPSFRINFNNQPIHPNVVIFSQTNKQTTIIFGTMLCILFLALNAITTRMIAGRFNNGFYNVLMMKSGEKQAYFWAIYIVDIAVHLMSMAIMLLLIYIIGFRIPDFWIPCFLFALANPLFIYVLIGVICLVLRKSEMVAQGWIFAIVFVYFFMFSSVPTLFYLNLKDYMIAKGTVSCFAFVPLANLISSFTTMLLYRQVAIWNNVSPLSVGPLGKYGAQFFVEAQIIFIFLYAISFYIILVGCCNRKPKNGEIIAKDAENLDPNVIRERLRIQSQNFDDSSTDLVKSLDLVKQYDKADPIAQEDSLDRPSFLPSENSQVVKDGKGALAVKGVSFGVRPGECFALLGVSGAGKTSTFNMIIGDDTLSGGKCSLDGVSVEDIYKKPEKLFGIVGYCPQNNCIEDFLTVRQTLTYLCGLLGVKVDTVANVVRDTMHRFELSEFADTKAEFLSGGNKRKLCCAMAMLGNPKVIFVDEASTGVDPVSRRVMWKGMRYEASNSALILTTHTLEEAEALASKIGIMVAGQFKCFGSLQQIQAEYGQGFEIEINLNIAQLADSIVEMNRDTRFTLDLMLVQNQLQALQRRLQGKGVKVMFDFANQFTKQGLLSAFFEKLDQKEIVDLMQIQREVLVQNVISSIVTELNESIADTEVIMFDATYLQLRLKKREDLSYGKLYGFVEQMQKRLSIKEYSCKQASLEQIFVSFAQEDQLKAYNSKLAQQQNKLLSTISLQ